MQARKSVRYWLAAAVLVSLILTPTLFAAQSASPAQFEQKMEMALKIWYAQHADADEMLSLHVISADGAGSIEGLVSESGNKPIEGADVFGWAILTDKVVSQSAKTDAEGRYTLENLDAGDYLVIASAEGYETGFYGGGKSPLDAAPVAVQDGEVTSGIDITLQKAKKGTGSISGNVMGHDAPLAGAWVVAFGKTNPFGMHNAFDIADENGDYKIADLPAGMYLLAAYANGYIPEVYDDATNVMNATPITVGAGDVTDKNFVLEKGGSISGHVQNDQGEPLANVKVTAHSSDEFMPGAGIPGLTKLTQMAYTDADGNYAIQGLTTGEYKVSAVLALPGYHDVQFYNDKDTIEEADPVSVTQGQVAPDINFAFVMPTAKIAGTVTDVNGNPLQDIYIYYVMENADYHQNWGRLWKSTLTDENGYYELPNLAAGTYYVSAWFWDWMNFNGIWYENADSLKNATPIELADGETRDDINMTLDLTSDYGSISGLVTLDDGGAAVPNAIVEAIPVDRKANGPLKKRLPTMVAFTEDDGAYSLAPLYKGDYYVRVHVNNVKEYYDDKENLEDADVLTVVAGENTPDINFGVSGAPQEGSSISGMITDETTGEPLADAIVVVFPTLKHQWFNGDMRRWNKVYYTSVTDDLGMYTVSGITEGQYVVAAWARDYIAEFYDGVRHPLRATVFELDGVAAETDVNFALMPRSGHRFAEGVGRGRFGSIGGRIQSQNGLPVEGAFVYAVDGDNNVVASEISGENGSYSLDGLDEGDYTVMASRSLYESTYYPNAAEFDDATMLTLNAEGDLNYADANIVMHTEEITSAESSVSGLPAAYELSQNYPNPFNPTTVIEYRVPEAANVTLQVFNVQGQLVKTLADKFQNAGAYQVTWDGTDMNGAIVPTGVYFYQILANDFAQVKRLVFMR